MRQAQRIVNGFMKSFRMYGFPDIQAVFACLDVLLLWEGTIPGLNIFEAQIMREVTIPCPGPGSD